MKTTNTKSTIGTTTTEKTDKVKLMLNKGYVVDVSCEKCGSQLNVMGWDNKQVVLFCDCPRDGAYLHFVNL